MFKSSHFFAEFTLFHTIYSEALSIQSSALAEPARSGRSPPGAGKARRRRSGTVLRGHRGGYCPRQMFPPTTNVAAHDKCRRSRKMSPPTTNVIPTTNIAPPANAASQRMSHPTECRTPAECPQDRRPVPANELCIVCGTEVAILVFSPAGKPFSYGDPSMENVVARFLNDGAAVPPKATPAAATPTPDRCDEIKQSLTYWTDCLETEKRRRGQLEAALKEPWPVPKPFWWDADLCSMSMPELIDYQNVLRQQQFHGSRAER
ncbi:Agamous-like MADS-box protein AGL61 [Platanthera zijinensis]|uniref:Agamous-like MADS-box protein AGL61 n=1 Tax=Platanthera zijinensis TaxID=2320716 RepID=A0AAP0BZ64_9ASPA